MLLRRVHDSMNDFTWFLGVLLQLFQDSWAFFCKFLKNTEVSLEILLK